MGLLIGKLIKRKDMGINTSNLLCSRWIPLILMLSYENYNCITLYLVVKKFKGKCKKNNNNNK